MNSYPEKSRRISNIKVSFLITSLNGGGAERQMTLLIKELNKRGWPVSICTLVGGGLFEAEVRNAGIEVYSLGLGGISSLPPVLWRLVRWLRNEKPDVLVSFMFHANILSSIASRVSGIRRSIMSVRTERFGGAGREWLMRVAAKRAVALTTNSELVKNHWTARALAPKTKFHVTRNAVLEPPHPAKNLRAQVRAELGIHEDDFLWLAIGSLRHCKGRETLIQAVSQLAGNGRRFHVLLVGDGPKRMFLEQLSKSNQVESFVSFLGFREDAKELFLAADGHVLNSLREGMPNVVLEAMIAGVPTIATRVGGVPEMVKDNETGWVVEPGKVDDLYTRMNEMMKLDPQSRIRMGEQARQLVLEQHGICAVVDAWQHLLIDVAGTQ